MDIKTVDHINAIIAEKLIAVVVKGSTPAEDQQVATVNGLFIKNEIFNTASKELDTAMNSSATLNALLAGNSDLKEYLIYSALVELGLNYNDKKAEKATALDSLKPTIKKEGKDKLAEKLNDKLATINVSDILNDGSAEKAEYQKKIDLINSLKFNAANGIQTKTAAQLADALAVHDVELLSLIHI